MSKIHNLYSDNDNEVVEMEDSKYIDQRFENFDLKLQYLDERSDSKFNILCEKIDNLASDMREVKLEVREDNKATRRTIITTAIASIIALFVGLGGILFMINQLQNAWLQEYMNVYANSLEALVTALISAK